ncbi:MAG: GAF domain-containing protein [Chloroflexi bacterium]|nr:GAF domain-containing protein [Chloroflexota bacterium]MCI0579102.1 GAF domain-containing protein [Chloroflexota bacterium]MCI0650076.1 GAF domain-containing protein [Chloroflexota bacterium]MCI0728298.1 GAF domain-containing protein [Chloroflexota bacterium]
MSAVAAEIPWTSTPEDQYRMAEVLRKTTAAVGSSLDLKDVLNRLLVALGDVVTYDSVSIALINEGEIDFTAHRGYADEATVVKHANTALRDSLILKEIVATKKAVVLDDVRNEPRWIVVKGAEHVRSFIAAPLVAGDTVLGVLMVDSVHVGAYGGREKWLVSTLASQAAVAVQNARLHEEVQRQLTELMTLYEATATMTAELDQSSVMQTVVKEFAAALQADECTMFVWESGRRNLIPMARVGAGQSDHSPAGDISTLSQIERHPTVRQVFETREPCILRRDGGTDQYDKALLKAARLQSLLLVPLIWRNQELGLLALGRAGQQRPRPFSNQDIRLARNLARQAAVAIEHADLYGQAQRRVDELSAFHDIALQLNTPLELNVVLDVITNSALKLIEANNVHIFLYDQEKDELTFGSALSRDGSRTPAVSKPRRNGITATTAHTGEPVIISDAASHPLLQSPEASAWGIGAIAGFPLKRGDRVLGAFTLTYLQKHQFTEDEQLLLSLLADQAAVAVENARLFADAQRRLRDMSALVDMAQQVTGNLRVELVMETTVQVLQKLLNARASSIVLLSEQTQELVIEAAAGINPKWVHRARMKVGEGVSGKAVSERRPIYIQDTYAQPDFLFFDEVVRSLIAVPLISRDEVIGALAVDSDRPNAFDQSDIQLMTVAAAQVSTAIANARLYEEAEDRAAKLAVAYEELKESDRLKDELVQNVSHELRTPLTFVKGYVDLLMDGEMGLITPEQHSTLQIVADKTVEITRLVDDIMSLQRIDVGNLIKEEFSIAKLIQEAVAGHRLTADRKGINLIFEPPTSDGLVVADRGRITQVLDNLIVNAMKFSPDGGDINIQMEDEGPRIIVMVSDEGIGVPQDKLERIFERFYQVDGTSRRRFGGAGIGLAIVKRIVDAHQGQIWVESELNRGSAFYFALPRHQEAR